MNENEMLMVMNRLEEYYKNFYSGSEKQRVFDSWFKMFRDDDASEVNYAVIEYICTNGFAPTVAGIKTIMAENRMHGQMTEMEAWQKVRNAIEDATSRAEAKSEFSKLPPILQKIVSSPSQLIAWRKVNDDTLEGVIASNVMRSYRELAKREAIYHALPKSLQGASSWRNPAQFTALPEPEKKPERALERAKEPWEIQREQMEQERKKMETQHHDSNEDFGKDLFD